MNDDDGTSVSLQNQVMELQLIESMYPQQMMFFNDKVSALVLQELVEVDEGLDVEDGLPIEFVFTMPSSQVELIFTLPLNYPSNDKLSCHVRLLDTTMTSSRLKALQNQANVTLTEMLSQDGVDVGESSQDKRRCDVNVLSVIQWMEEFERTHLQTDSQVSTH